MGMIRPRSTNRSVRASESGVRPTLLRKLMGTTREFDRTIFLMVGVIILTAVVVGRLFDLQVLQHPFYEALAADQHVIWQELQPSRGQIFVQDFHGDPSSTPELYPIATNQELTHVYAIPKRMTDTVRAADELSRLLELDRDVLLARFQKADDLYEPVDHNVPEELVGKVRELGLEGIDFAPEQGRHYAESLYWSHLTGFVGFTDGEKKGGQYGIEQEFNTELSGKPGSLRAERTATGQIIGIGERMLEPAENGANIVLTIERSVQYKACAELVEAVKTYAATAGEMVIMDPKTGKVLAMCNVPTFDANAYSDIEDISVLNNRTTSAPYEPGSVFKSLTMAAALEEGTVAPDTVFHDPAVEVIAGYTIRNYDDRDYGTQTMTGCLENSVNTCMIHVMRTIGTKMFYDYLVRFGFGKQAGADLPGESAGSLGELESGKEIFGATAAFGQGVTTTALQLAVAYSAIANGGKLLKPQIVDSFQYPNGFVREIEPEVVGQPISSKTAKTLSAMLASVVENGHARRAAVPGYYVAGKTGTAQIATEGGYDPNQTNHTFTGFFPVSDPQIVVVLHLEKPTAGRDAAVTAAPAFAKIAKFLADYYRIPEDRDLP